MNSLKIHLGFILPLLIICFCFEFVFLITNTVKHYENNLNNDYSVVIASDIKLSEDNMKDVKYFQKLEILSTEDILNQLKNNISQKNLDTLKDKLPNFYSIKFNKFINENEVNDIKNELLKIKNIIKVETFSKTHIKIYKLLVVIKFILYTFLVFAILLSIVLFFKQIRIWLYQHQERIYILTLFGANFFQKASTMLYIVFLDNIICFVLLVAFFLNFYNISLIVDYFASIGIDLPVLNFLPSLIQISFYSLIFSLLCVIIVMLKVRK
ncbi:ABC transporter permease [Campylobacter sp. MG1]|uniref:ABC transporter permease n=1 Tax=Campylobacter sp. MG1 TaxID=2976332 RepID=UPI00226C69A4|nr:ABC transporter permease [Campylobacter sp. MG1]